jgi:hypothetical protein
LTLREVMFMITVRVNGVANAGTMIGPRGKQNIFLPPNSTMCELIEIPAEKCGEPLKEILLKEWGAEN